MKNLRAKNKKWMARWVMMAAVDVVLVSFTSPLSVYIGITFEQNGLSPKFWALLGIQIFCNGISLILGYIISWLIYSKGLSK